MFPDAEEPDPAEVVGDEDDPAERDLSYREHRPGEDVYRDTLDQRLREEVRDRILEEQEPEAPEFDAPELREAPDVEAPLAERDRGEDPIEETDRPARRGGGHPCRPEDKV